MMKGISAILGSIFAERQKRKDKAPYPEIELSGGGGATGLYEPSSRTLMLESVLSQKSGSASRDARPKAAGARAPSRMRIGDELRLGKEALASSGAALARLCDAPTADYLARLLAVTESQSCQIAFIGQMNAGKSTLINALVGAPDLLPSEITPWTTVVTNLYFGVPGKPTGGAVFEFFNEEEWRQLSDGGGRVRALTERLMPDFPWQSFQQQVSAMREAAERRLGGRYQELLGTQHAFDALEEGLLARYVAAQSPLADEDGSTSGEFSAITKSAHIYFDLMNFFYPTVLIDTPGINDPFLVRDEITRRNLERANIFVIVVTARQPLSNVDLDLLRILHGLRKENFIIFVNKIDEVDQFEDHADAIVGRIRGLIGREFPDAEFSIISGCAEWAAVALGPDTQAQRDLARMHGISGAPAVLAGEAPKAFWLSDPSAADAALADAILTRSGVPDLAAAISEILHSGAIAGGLAHAITVLRAMAENGLARAEAASALVKELARLAGGEEAALRQKTAVLSGKLDQASGALSCIAAGLDSTEAEFRDIAGRAQTDLAQRLRARLDDHLRGVMEAAAKPREAAAARHSLSTELRTALEAEFATTFQETVAGIGGLAMRAEQSVTDDIALAGRFLETRIAYPRLPAVKCSPSLAALGEPISIELGGPAYMSTWVKLPSEQKRRSLAAVEAEFAAVIERLVQSAREELARTTAFVLDHFRLNAAHALDVSIAHRRGVVEACRAPDADGARDDHLARAETEAKAFAGVIAGLGQIRLGELDGGAA